MGSVSSLISGHSFHRKHCKGSENKLKKGLQSKKTGRSLDGLLKYGFTQDHCSTNNNSKVSYHSGKNNDFFYIKVSNKPQTANINTAEDKNVLIRPTAFKPVLPRSTSSSVETHNNLSTILGKRISPIDRLKDLQDSKLETNSGTFSDSGRNSMSSLPTHSISGSSQMDNLSTSTNHMARHGCLAQNMDTSQKPQGGVAGMNGNSGTSWMCSGTNGGNSWCGSKQIPTKPSSSGGCVRSPISMDESLIQQLEQKLLERETELAELQTSLEEKETDTCHLFEEKQRYCAEEMEGLKQHCSTKLRQVSQRALRAQQLLQLQVIQLQQDKERLQEEVDQLNHDRDTAESRLRIYESQKNLAPTLEETQWEVCQKSGEISLLKQQFRDSQADVGNKLSEIVSLKASLKESRCKMEELEKKIKEYEEALHQRSAEVEVSKNEFQRKKNEADLLREKVNLLEMDIKNMKQDLAMAKEEQHKTLNHNGGTANLDALQKEVERLRGELKEEKQKKNKMMNSFQQERQTWNKEKDKVIRYQKQLQYNYLQMYRKNKGLEKILRELTAEMDSRTEMDMDSHSSDLNFEKIVATEI
uniref:Leucine zipper putative tumor suppressor 1-like n=1 Tax=Sinocyclocheilus rhinocerous TaxID=307959 RepID=A0A673GCI7_9TELE